MWPASQPAFPSFVLGGFFAFCFVAWMDPAKCHRRDPSVARRVPRVCDLTATAGNSGRQPQQRAQIATLSSEVFGDQGALLAAALLAALPGGRLP